MSTKIIHVQWDGPFTLSNVVKLSDKRTDYGIYQIYGSHPIYGNNTLLYIGKACQQTFAERISQENWKGWELGQGRIQVHIGRLSGSTTPKRAEWNQEIDLVELLLLTAHKPAHNASGIVSLSNAIDMKIREIHVLNWGNCQDLLPEISGARWSNKFDNPINYDHYGKHH